MILADTLIKQTVNDGKIKIEGYDEEKVQPASYDLRVGDQGITTSSGTIIDIKKAGFLELAPGDFGTILVYEGLEFDNQHVARFGLRSYYSRKGIVASIGPQIDPGFKGKLKIGVVNLSPHKIVFPYLDDFLTMEIHRLSEPAENPYQGPYQNEKGLSASDISNVKEGENMGFGSMMKNLASLTTNVDHLAKSIDHLTRDHRILKWAIGIVVALAIVSFFKD